MEDARELIFHPETHSYYYFLNGKTVKAKYSVTSLKKKFFPSLRDEPPFNGKEVVEKYYEKWKCDPGCNKYSDFIADGSAGGMTDDEIKKEICRLWDLNGRTKASLGTILHAKIEDYYIKNGCNNN